MQIAALRVFISISSGRGLVHSGIERVELIKLTSQTNYISEQSISLNWLNSFSQLSPREDSFARTKLFEHILFVRFIIYLRETLSIRLSNSDLYRKVDDDTETRKKFYNFVPSFELN